MLDNILFRVECVLLPVMVNILTVLFLMVSYFVYCESVSILTQMTRRLVGTSHASQIHQHKLS